jgi:hypothetical protein
MSRGTQTFWQADAVRAINAVRAAGEEIARIEIDREGKIVEVVGKPEVQSLVDLAIELLAFSVAVGIVIAR